MFSVDLDNYFTWHNIAVFFKSGYGHAVFFKESDDAFDVFCF